MRILVTSWKMGRERGIFQKRHPCDTQAIKSWQKKHDRLAIIKKTLILVFNFIITNLDIPFECSLCDSKTSMSAAKVQPQNWNCYCKSNAKAEHLESTLFTLILCSPFNTGIFICILAVLIMRRFAFSEYPLVSVVDSHQLRWFHYLFLHSLFCYGL